eukprot:scaffold121908_cov54-Phaeocystis_antarctica.AAC.1
MRLTCTLRPSRSTPKAWASSGVSLTPRMRMYSAMTERPLRATNSSTPRMSRSTVYAEEEGTSSSLREGQVDPGRVEGEATHLAHHAHGGDGDARSRHAPHLAQPLQRTHQRIVVVERLAHTHEHDVAHAPVDAERGCHPLHMQHLLEDLTGAEVILEAHRACGAEGAAHLAPHLRRDTHGDPPLRARGRCVHDRNRLDLLAAREADDELEALVGARRAGLGHRGGGHRAALLEQRRAGFGHAGGQASRRQIASAVPDDRPPQGLDVRNLEVVEARQVQDGRHVEKGEPPGRRSLLDAGWLASGRHVWARRAGECLKKGDGRLPQIDDLYGRSRLGIQS